MWARMYVLRESEHGRDQLKIFSYCASLIAI